MSQNEEICLLEGKFGRSIYYMKITNNLPEISD